MERLSKTQQHIFNYIKDVLDARGVAPSVREIAAAVGLKSTSTVQYHLQLLEQKGYIEKDPNLKRTLRISNRGLKAQNVPLIGTVTAGEPILAVQNIEDYLPVPVARRERTLFALRVKGDSMINAAIEDGDIAIVEQTPTAENGDIVVALIGEEATVKRFYKENGGFRLQPENERYEPILVKELSILGKVIMIIRNYD